KELTERKRASAAEQRHAMWLEVILSSIADGLLVTDEFGIVTYVNAAGEKITHIAGDSARGKAVDALFRLVDEETGETLRSPIYEALGRMPPEPRPEKTSLITPDERKIPVIVSSAVMREDAGAILGAVFVFHDMTRLREIEARRADIERRFTALADAVPALIWMSGSDGSWEYFNSAWRQLTGLPAEQMHGYGWMSVIHPEDVDECVRVYKESFDTRTPFAIEHRLLDLNKQYRW